MQYSFKEFLIHDRTAISIYYKIKLKFNQPYKSSLRFGMEVFSLIFRWSKVLDLIVNHKLFL